MTEPVLQLTIDESKVYSRHYFASSHLWAALQSRDRSKDLEDRFAGSAVSVHQIQRANVVNAVLSSVAFVEGFINEIYSDAVDGTFPNKADPLSADTRAEFVRGWEDFKQGKRGNIFEKAKAGAAAAGSSFDLGGTVGQDARLLVDFRDAIVHFKPAWQNNEESDLSRRLSRAVKPSKLLADNDGSPWFPMRAMGADAAGWAVDTATNFVGEWVLVLGLPRYWDTDIAAFAKEAAVAGV